MIFNEQITNEFKYEFEVIHKFRNYQTKELKGEYSMYSDKPFDAQYAKEVINKCLINKPDVICEWSIIVHLNTEKYMTHLTFENTGVSFLKFLNP